MGIDLKHLRQCISRACADKPTERIPDLIYKAFVAARKKQLEATPTLKLRKAVAPKPLKTPVKPVRKVLPEKEFDTMFMPIQDELVGNSTMRRRKTDKKKKDAE